MSMRNEIYKLIERPLFYSLSNGIYDRTGIWGFDEMCVRFIVNPMDFLPVLEIRHKGINRPIRLEWAINLNGISRDDFDGNVLEQVKEDVQ